MAKATFSDELDELSRLLDEINIGHEPQNASLENKELVETAQWIKKAGIMPAPPRQLIEATVDKVLADFTPKPAKRKYPWLYSGALGTAAAVLLVIGLNTSLFSPKQPANLQLPPVETILQASNQEAVLDKKEPSSATKTEPQNPVSQPSNAGTAPSQPTTPNTTIQQTPQKVAASQDIPSALSKIPESSAVPSESDKSAKKRPPYLAARKIENSEAQPSNTLLMKALTPQLTPLSLPGKQPDSVIIDKDSGAITQVYAKGTPDELILIQETMPDKPTTDGQAAATDTPSAASKTKTAEQPELRQVSITLDGQKVTMKGRQSESELVKLAHSLQ